MQREWYEFPRPQEWQSDAARPCLAVADDGATTVPARCIRRARTSYYVSIAWGDMSDDTRAWVRGIVGEPCAAIVVVLPRKRVRALSEGA